MSIYRYVRAVGGLLSIITLLVVLIAHELVESVTVSPMTVSVLLGLIGSLLGVDILLQRVPGLRVTVETTDDDDT